MRRPYATLTRGELLGIPAAFVTGGLVAALVVSSGMPKSGTQSPTASPTVAGASSTSAAPSAGPTVAPATASPSNSADSWGALVWSEPEAMNAPWSQPPDQIVSWQGQYVGGGVVDVAGKDQVVVAESLELGIWTVLAQGARAPFAGGPVGRLLAGPSLLVALGLGPGTSGPCRSPLYLGGWDTCPVTGVWTSADGETWTQADHHAFGRMQLADASGGARGLVAVGVDGSKPVILYSTSGSVWQAADTSGPAFAGATVDWVTATPDGFIVSGSVSGLATGWWSTDGLAWHTAAVQQPDPSGEDLGRVYRTANGFFALGRQMSQIEIPTMAAWVSTDGRSWIVDPDPVGPYWPSGESNALFNLFYGNGRRLVAFGVDASMMVGSDPVVGFGGYSWGYQDISTSKDGVNWHSLRIEGFPGAMVLIGSEPHVVVTSDGLIAFGRVPGSSEWLILRAIAAP